ncbi:MAG: DM13 domain-containing protein [Pseudomonadota bacterium]
MRIIAMLFLGLTLAACGGEQTKSEAPSTGSTQSVAGDVVTTGEFSGLSEHITTGDVTIKKAEDGYYVVLEENFSLDGAPDPKLGFGNSGEYDIESQFSVLNKKTGYQSYKLPADIDPTQYNEIYVWCEQFSVPLGVASINS